MFFSVTGFVLATPGDRPCQATSIASHLQGLQAVATSSSPGFEIGMAPTHQIETRLDIRFDMCFLGRKKNLYQLQYEFKSEFKIIYPQTSSTY